MTTPLLTTQLVDTYLNLFRYNFNKIYLVPTDSVSSVFSEVQSAKVGEIQVSSSDVSAPEEGSEGPNWRSMSMDSALLGYGLSSHSNLDDISLVYVYEDQSNPTNSKVWGWVAATSIDIEVGDTLEKTTSVNFISINKAGV